MNNLRLVLTFTFGPTKVLRSLDHSLAGHELASSRAAMALTFALPFLTFGTFEVWSVVLSDLASALALV